MKSWVDIYYFSVLDYVDSVNIESCLAVCNESEHSRYRQFRQPTAGLLFVLARWIVRSTLSEHLAVSPQSIEFDFNDHGKPFVKGSKALHFNLSHCDGAVAVAISNDEVGIDVELHQRRGEPWRQAEKFMNNAVAEQLRCLDDANKPAAFIRYWSAMEALVKLNGVSLFNLKDEFLKEGGVINNDKVCATAGAYIISWDTGLGRQLSLAVAQAQVVKHFFVFNGREFESRTTPNFR